MSWVVAAMTTITGMLRFSGSSEVIMEHAVIEIRHSDSAFELVDQEYEAD